MLGHDSLPVTGTHNVEGQDLEGHHEPLPFNVARSFPSLNTSWQQRWKLKLIRDWKKISCWIVLLGMLVLLFIWLDGTEHLSRIDKADNHKKLAIVMPFVAPQISIIFKNWDKWIDLPMNDEEIISRTSWSMFPSQNEYGNDHNRKFAPCRDISQSRKKVKFILMFNGDLGSYEKEYAGTELGELSGREIETLIRNKWESVKGRDCFGQLEIVSASTPKKLWGYPSNPCFMFFKTWQLVEDMGFSYYYQMEPDVVPVRDFVSDCCTIIC